MLVTWTPAVSNGIKTSRPSQTKTSFGSKKDQDRPKDQDKITTIRWQLARPRRYIKFIDLFSLINLKKLTFSSFAVWLYSSQSSVQNSQISWQLIPAFYILA